jgi:GNAT superfamily N-acetyltransferase
MSVATASTRVDIQPLTPASSADYFAFFDGDAFADNPRWASCYCHFLWAPTDIKPWNRWTGTENRAAVAELIATRQLQGYLAYVAGKPVGWCNATPKVKIPALREERDPAAATVGAIACFVIAKPFRHQGVARRLLAAACKGFEQDGLKCVEAYARQGATGEAENHTGPLQLYLSSGFAIVREDGDGGAIVRKTFARR